MRRRKYISKMGGRETSKTLSVVLALMLAPNAMAVEGGRALSSTKSKASLVRVEKEDIILIAQDSSFEDVNDATTTASSRPRTDLPHPTSNNATPPNKQPQVVAGEPNAYIIGEQDSLMITVWKEKELSGSVVVRPDGKITVPLVGELKVTGMTPAQLQSLLAEKLKPFVTIPQVTVAVTEIRSRKIYLVGHAAREGAFPVNSSTTALQIIAQAGGLKDFAKRKKIYILRQQGNEQVRYSFNYDNVIKGKSQEQNILLQPGDTIVVP